MFHHSSMVGLALILVAAEGACARSSPYPIITPLPVLSRSGSYDAAADIRLCRGTVLGAAPTTMQPRWLPPLSQAQNGVVLGTADIPHPALPSETAYRREMERCLSDRGYEVRGWH